MVIAALIDGSVPAFAAPWEARLDALVRALIAQGCFDVEQWSAALANMPAEAPDGAAARSLKTLEGLLTARGVMTCEAVSARAEAVLAGWPQPSGAARAGPIAICRPLDPAQGRSTSL